MTFSTNIVYAPDQELLLRLATKVEKNRSIRCNYAGCKRCAPRRNRVGVKTAATPLFSTPVNDKVGLP